MGLFADEAQHDVWGKDRNVLVASDGRLCLLDWGLAGHLTRRLRLALADFWIAAVEQDAERIVRFHTLCKTIIGMADTTGAPPVAPALIAETLTLGEAIVADHRG